MAIVVHLDMIFSGTLSRTSPFSRRENASAGLNILKIIGVQSYGIFAGIYM